jgi:hypothetical protein
MVGLNQVMQSNDPTVEALNHIKIAVKSLIITLVYVIGYHSKKKVQLSNKMWGAMVGLTITNIFIAVLWG